MKPVSTLTSRCKFMVFRSLVVICGLVAGTSHAADEAAQKLINQAIEAHGGKAQLAKMKAVTWTAKGNMSAAGQTFEYTANYTWQIPDKFRFEMDLPGGAGKMSVAYNGKTAWEKVDDFVQDMEAEKLAGFRQNVFAMGLTTLLPLQDPALTVTKIEDKKDGDKDLAGIKVTAAGRKDVMLYFDKQTHLLAYSKTQAYNDFGGGWTDQEVWYKDYKKEEAGGFGFQKMTIKMGDQITINESMSGLKLVDKLDAKLFEKPAQKPDPKKDDE